MAFIVAIDGPSGTGKGTVAKIVSEKLNLMYLDTGATYRCVTLKLLNENVELNDIEKIKKILNEINIEFKDNKVFLDGEDVTKEIREEKVAKNVSQVSHILEVRLAMVDLQRRMCIDKDSLLEGRDIATNVFPNADVKIYLDASVDERVKRRIKQNKEKGIEMPDDEVRKNIEQRDYNDIHSDIGPLKRDEDAIYIDTTKLSINQVVNKITQIIKRRKKLNKRVEYGYVVTKQTKRKIFMREFLRHLFKILFHMAFRIKIIGIEKIYKDEAYIICPNHVNYIDAMIIQSSSKRNIRFICKADLFEKRIINWSFHFFDNIPVNRKTDSDVASMKLCLKALKNKEALGIFPEGTRKGFERNIEVKDGATYLAYKAGVKIVPVGINGTFKPFSKVTIKYGDPIDVSKYKVDESQNKEWIKNATSDLVRNIKELSK